MEEEAAQQNNFLLSLPVQMTRGSDEKICTELFGAATDRGDGSITVKVFTKADFENEAEPSLTKSVNVLSSENKKCFNLTIPAKFNVHNHGELDAGNGNIRVSAFQSYVKYNDDKVWVIFEGEFNKSNYKIAAYRELKLRNPDVFPLIQTDKGKYKEKDKVQFRIMIFDEYLKPTDRC